MVAIPYPGHLITRVVSFVMACAWSGLLLFFPKAVTGGAGGVSHGLLTLLLWGVAAGFVHGVGFEPRHPLWRLVFHPLSAWALMVGCAWVLWT